MGMIIGLMCRSLVIFVLVMSLRIIGFSWMQTSILIAASLLLPMINPSRVLARASIGLILIWSIAITLGAAPTYPDLSKGIKSLSGVEIPQAIQDGIPKVKNGLVEMILTGFHRTEKDNISPREANAQGLPGDFGEQMQAVELLARSGAIRQDDADRLKKEISEKALGRLASQTANH